MKKNLVLALIILTLPFFVNGFAYSEEKEAKNVIEKNIENYFPTLMPVKNGVSADTKEFSEVKSNEILIKFKPNINLEKDDEVKAALNNIVKSRPGFAEIIKSKRVFSDNLLEKNKEAKKNLGLTRWIKITIDPQADAETQIQMFKSHPDVEKAEINSFYRVFSDPLYYLQWHLNNTGNTSLIPFSVADADVDAPEAWGIQTGSNNVIIAIVDTGVDWQHQDLDANVLINDGYDFVDLTGSIYLNMCDDEHGEDCVIEDNDPDDVFGHGTHCAGIAAAEMDNSFGVRGICPNCKILPVRAGFQTYSGLFGTSAALLNEDTSQGIIYAADNGANIISMSFGGTYPSSLLNDAINYAYNEGVVLIAAAGNSDTNVPSYPAGFDNVIAVGATTPADEKSSYSNYGFRVDLAAPGGGWHPTQTFPQLLPERILSTIPGNDFAYMCGTSMASPLVAGIAGLILSEYPNFNQEQVYTALLNSTDDIGEPDLGAGRINSYSAVTIGSNVPSIKANILEIEDSFIGLSSPSKFYLLYSSTGIKNIIGTAFSDYPNSSYVLKLINESSGEETILTTGEANIQNGILATIEPSTMDSGLYVLKLEITSGNFIVRELKQLEIGNMFSELGTNAPLAVADIDPDYPGLEYAFVSHSGGTAQVYVFHADNTLADGFPQTIQFGSGAAPSLGDIDNDGYLEIVIGPWESNLLYAFNHDGTPMNSHWPITMPSMQASTAVLADTNNDDFLEIIVTILDVNFQTYIFDRNGQLLRALPIGHGEPPAVADIDNDGVLEIVSGGLYQYQGDHWTSKIAVYDVNGNLEPGWPITVIGEPFGPIIVGDVDTTNPGLEIVWSTSEYLGSVSSGRVYAWTKNGVLLQGGWPKNFNSVVSGPSLTNYITSGPAGENLEIAVVAEGSLYVLDYLGQVVAPSPFAIFQGSFGGHIISGDFDGDLAADFAISSYHCIVNGSELIWRGYFSVLNHFGEELFGTIISEGNYFECPIVADLNGDNLSEIIVGSWSGIYQFQLNSLDTLGYWPQFQHDARHTGFYQEIPLAPVAPASFTANSTSTTTIQLSWQDVDNEDGYKIWRSTDPYDFPSTPIATPTANSTSIDDAGLIPNTHYYYKLAAYNQAGNSAEVFANAITLPLAQPTILVPQQVSTIQAAITSAVSGQDVIVSPGTYTENLTMKSGVDVIGTNKETTLLNSNPAYPNTPLVNFSNKNNCSLSNVKLQGTFANSFGINIDNASNILISENIFEGRQIAVHDNSTATIRNNTFRNAYPAALVMDSSNGSHNVNLNIRNNIFQADQKSIVVDIHQDSNVSITNNVIYGSTYYGLEIREVISGSFLTVKNNIITQNYIGISAGGAEPQFYEFSYNDVWGNGSDPYYTAGTEDISADPLFLNPINGNFVLGANSPCINTGDPVPVYNDPDGSRNDMGAYGGPYAIIPRITPDPKRPVGIKEKTLF